MAKVNNIKRLVAEDFDQDYQDLVRQIAYTTNPFFEQITQAFNKSIDFENLNQDLVTIEAYHCSQVNPYSIGIEMYQELDGTITEATLNTAVKICDVICTFLSIPKQFPSSNSIMKEFARPDGKAHKTKKRAYMEGGLSGKEFFGVFGHRNATRNRGKGDPGDLVFDKLTKFGFIRLDI